MAPEGGLSWMGAQNRRLLRVQASPRAYHPHTSGGRDTDAPQGQDGSCGAGLGQGQVCERPHTVLTVRKGGHRGSNTERVTARSSVP